MKILVPVIVRWESFGDEHLKSPAAVSGREEQFHDRSGVRMHKQDLQKYID